MSRYRQVNSRIKLNNLSTEFLFIFSRLITTEKKMRNSSAVNTYITLLIKSSCTFSPRYCIVDKNYEGEKGRRILVK